MKLLDEVVAWQLISLLGDEDEAACLESGMIREVNWLNINHVVGETLFSVPSSNLIHICVRPFKVFLS